MGLERGEEQGTLSLGGAGGVESEASARQGVAGHDSPLLLWKAKRAAGLQEGVGSEGLGRAKTRRSSVGTSRWPLDLQVGAPEPPARAP